MNNKAPILINLLDERQNYLHILCLKIILKRSQSLKEMIKVLADKKLSGEKYYRCVPIILNFVVAEEFVSFSNVQFVVTFLFLIKVSLSDII